MAAIKHSAEYEFMERFHIWVTGQIINQLLLLTRKHVILVASVVLVAA
jgi:hypothetical protein